MCLAVAAVAGSHPERVVAYSLWGCHFNTPNLKWKDATTRPGYAGPAQNAATAWTATPTPIYLTKVTSGANIQVNDGNFGDPSFNGITYPSGCDSNQHWTATIVTWFNRAALDTKSVAARQNTMVHELGHALGLAHTFDPNCATMGIMYVSDASFVSCGFTTPRPDDIDGINFLY